MIHARNMTAPPWLHSFKTEPVRLWTLCNKQVSDEYAVGPEDHHKVTCLTCMDVMGNTLGEEKYR